MSFISEIAGHSIVELAQKYKTPAFLYQKDIIEKRISEVRKFDVVRFAQKACGNIAILQIMRNNHVAVDAVSAGEIYRAILAGYKTGPGIKDIVYTADIFDNDAVEFIKKYHISVNTGSPDMLEQLGTFVPGATAVLRINPGFGHGHSQKVNTGGELSKHGIWHEDIKKCLDISKKSGVHINGIHMHIGSGSDFDHLAEVCDAMLKSACELGPQVEMISTGGGLPIPYHKDEPRIDTDRFFNLWHSTRQKLEKKFGHPVTLETEPGRYLVAESGTLLTQIRSVKTSGGTRFYLVDAGFNTLIRPAMYGSYHEISIAPAHDGNFHSPETHETVVGGPLCESCDVFTQEEGGFVTKRSLPNAEAGDYLLLHDAGAYGSVMSSNYNTRPLAAEVLLTQEGDYIIREHQTFEHMLQNEKIPEILKSRG